MRKNQIDQGRFTEKGKGLGTVTEAMVRRRAEELALANGRSRDRTLNTDLEQARRELTGREGLTPQPTVAEQIPEEQRWQPIPESTGTKTEPTAAPDEQIFPEELVEEGVEEAEQDQMTRSTKGSLRRDRER